MKPSRTVFIRDRRHEYELSWKLQVMTKNMKDNLKHDGTLLTLIPRIIQQFHSNINMYRSVFERLIYVCFWNVENINMKKKHEIRLKFRIMNITIPILTGVVYTFFRLVYFEAAEISFFFVFRIFLGLQHLCVTTESFVRELMWEQQQQQYHILLLNINAIRMYCCYAFHFDILTPGRAFFFLKRRHGGT